MTETCSTQCGEGHQPATTARDLWDATDRLTQPTRTRLIRDNGASEWVEIPSLLDQLEEAVTSGRGGNSRGTQRSKPPLDTTALSLMFDITNTIRDGLRQRGIDRKLHNALDLRSLTSAVISGNDQSKYGPVHKKLLSWASQIKATISNDPNRTWRMHKAACRICQATSVPTWNDDGEQSRQPALIVHSNDGIIEHIDCDACGSKLEGPELTALIQEARRNTEATEGESAA